MQVCLAYENVNTLRKHLQNNKKCSKLKRTILRSPKHNRNTVTSVRLHSLALMIFLILLSLMSFHLWSHQQIASDYQQSVHVRVSVCFLHNDCSVTGHDGPRESGSGWTRLTGASSPSHTDAATAAAFCFSLLYDRGLCVRVRNYA